MADGRRPWQRNTSPAKRPARRMYAGAKVGRLDFGASTSSANGELYTSLRSLRNKSRALCRDVSHAKRARKLMMDNIIGDGVGLQGRIKTSRDDKLSKRLNDGVEAAWDRWSKADACHAGGELAFADMERMLISQWFETGEVFLRKIPARFGRSQVPLGLEVIEAERLADDAKIIPASGNAVTLGIEHDQWYRPVAYHVYTHNPAPLSHLPTYQRGEVLRIPADQILHLRIIDRWPQVRGVPPLHAVIRRLDQLGEYEHAALVAARTGASKIGFLQAQEWAHGDANVADQTDDQGNQSMNVRVGEVNELPMGWEFQSWDPAYPHELFESFLRASLRAIAAGLDVSYESLSKDYSQSNYSSSRLSLLDDRDVWRMLQGWYVRTIRKPLHAVWLQQAVLAGAIPEIGVQAYAQDAERFEAARYKLRGWGWVDPAKEVAAYKEAELAGYTTKSEIIAATGGGKDLEDVIEARRDELDRLAEQGIETDTTMEADASDPAIVETETADEQDDAERLRLVGDE